MRVCRYIVASACMLAAFASYATTYVYSVRMLLRVPRVYDNSTSEGYRKYQSQSVRGTMYVKTGEYEPEVSMYLTNRTHKVNGSRVWYSCTVDDVRFHMIGSNRTGRFPNPSVCMSLVAEPSYNAGGVDEDNTLMLTLAGKGSSYRSISGHVAGSLGCGCYAYGHVSPTRVFGSCSVVDTAAVYGTWRSCLVKVVP